MAKGLPAAEPEDDDSLDGSDERSAWAQHSATQAFEKDLLRHMSEKLQKLVQCTATSSDPAVREASAQYAEAKLAVILLRKFGTRGAYKDFKQTVLAP